MQEAYQFPSGFEPQEPSTHQVHQELSAKYQAPVEGNLAQTHVGSSSSRAGNVMQLSRNSGKVIFYALLVYFATWLGTNTVAAHQVLPQTFSMCAVWVEPLPQTAQSFMPELIYGTKRNLVKARMLLKSLFVIGASPGLVLGTIGTCVPWLFPTIFTPDPAVIGEMCKVFIPYFIGLCITCTHSCEGTLLAGRDLRFISLSMSGWLVWGTLLLMVTFTLSIFYREILNVRKV
ncbi:hypothetical protein Droror1_Dr00014443 [Drosera rotundifolia]